MCYGILAAAARRPRGTSLRPRGAPRARRGGLAEAPRAWWVKLRSALEDAGFVESRLEKACFLLRSPKGELVGMAVSHVDDVLFTGHGERYERAIAGLRKRFAWGSWLVNEFTHCGREVTRDRKDRLVLVSQEKYFENLTAAKYRKTASAESGGAPRLPPDGPSSYETRGAPPPPQARPTCAMRHAPCAMRRV